MAHPMATPHESSAREPQLRSVSSIHWQSVGRYAAATDAPLPLERHGLKGPSWAPEKKNNSRAIPNSLKASAFYHTKRLCHKNQVLMP